MVAALALVVDVHPFLALPGRLDHRAVGVEDRLPEEVFGLLLPDPHPGVVEGLLQGIDTPDIESPAEVPARGRVGNPPGPEGVEISLVVPQELQVLEPRAARQQVVGDVQNVVRLAIGQVNLQQVETVVDLAVETQPFHQQMHRADSTRGDRPSSIRDLVVDVRGGKFRPLRRPAIDPLQPPGDSLLAGFQLLAYFGVHSKLLRERRAA